MNVIGEAFLEVLPASTKFASTLHKDVSEAVEKTEKSSAGAFNGLAKIGQAAFFAIGTAAVSFGTLAVKAALEGEAAHANLENALKNTGSSIKALGPALEEEVAKFAKLGFTNDELESGLARMVQTTGDAKKSLGLMGLAADIAKATHKDLQAAVLLVGKAADGNVSALKRFGIEVQTTGDKTKDSETAIRLLTARFGGDAAAQANTYAGKLAALRAETHNLEESVGNALLPVLADLAGDLAGGAQYLERNRGAAVALGAAVGLVLVPALTIYIAKQVEAFGASAIENAGKLAEAVRGVGVAFGASGVAAESLTGIGIIAGVIALAVGLFELTSNAKASQKEIDAVSDSLLKLDKGQTNVNGVFEKANINWKQAKYGLDQFMESAEHSNAATQRNASNINNLGVNFDGLDKALAKLVKSGDTDLAARDFQAIADKTGYSTAQLKAAPGAFNDYKKALRDSKQSIELHKAALDQDNASLAAAPDAIGPLADALRDISVQTGTSTNVLGALATKLGVDLVKGGDAASATLVAAAERLKITSPNALALSDAMGKLRDQTSDAKDKMDAFKSALDAAIGVSIPEDKAINNLYKSLNNMVETVKKNKGNFNPVTQEGQDDIDAFDTSITAIRDHLEAIESRPHTTADLQNALKGDVELLRTREKAAGLTNAKIDELIAKSGLLSQPVQMIINADTSAAEQHVNDLLVLLKKIKVITNEQKIKLSSGVLVVTPNEVHGGGGPAATAVGGVFNSPEVRLIGEDGPEAVLPLTKPLQMQRVLSQIQPYMPASAAQSGGSVGSINSGPNINIGPFNNVDVDPLHLASRIAFEFVDQMVVT